MRLQRCDISQRARLRWGDQEAVNAVGGFACRREATCTWCAMENAKSAVGIHQPAVCQRRQECGRNFVQQIEIKICVR